MFTIDRCIGVQQIDILCILARHTVFIRSYRRAVDLSSRMDSSQGLIIHKAAVSAAVPGPVNSRIAVPLGLIRYRIGKLSRIDRMGVMRSNCGIIMIPFCQSQCISSQRQRPGKDICYLPLRCPRHMCSAADRSTVDRCQSAAGRTNRINLCLGIYICREYIRGRISGSSFQSLHASPRIGIAIAAIGIAAIDRIGQRCLRDGHMTVRTFCSIKNQIVIRSCGSPVHIGSLSEGIAGNSPVRHDDIGIHADFLGILFRCVMIYIIGRIKCRCRTSALGNCKCIPAL